MDLRGGSVRSSRMFLLLDPGALYFYPSESRYLNIALNMIPTLNMDDVVK
jgi:hypothetical protein